MVKINPYMCSHVVNSNLLNRTNEFRGEDEWILFGNKECEAEVKTDASVDNLDSTANSRVEPSEFRCRLEQMWT